MGEGPSCIGSSERGDERDSRSFEPYGKNKVIYQIIAVLTKVSTEKVCFRVRCFHFKTIPPFF